MATKTTTRSVRCPECGEAPYATLDTIPGYALMDENEDGTFTFASETEIDWDGQQTETDAANDQPLLICRNGCGAFTDDAFEVQG